MIVEICGTAYQGQSGGERVLVLNPEHFDQVPEASALGARIIVFFSLLSLVECLTSRNFRSSPTECEKEGERHSFI